MSRYKLIANDCKNDLTPRCPSSEVRLRMSFEEIPLGKETPVFDIVAEGSRLNDICEACDKFEPKDK